MTSPNLDPTAADAGESRAGSKRRLAKVEDSDEGQFGTPLQLNNSIVREGTACVSSALNMRMCDTDDDKSAKQRKKIQIKFIEVSGFGDL